MPKAARYPLFLLGLVIILLGGIVLNSRGASPAELGGLIAVGFGFLVLAVVVK